MVWVIGGVSVAVLAIGYLVYLIVESKHEVDEAPRVAMFNCEKHGLIPQQYILKLDVLSEKPIEYCPMCWQDKMDAAKKAGKL